MSDEPEVPDDENEESEETEELDLDGAIDLYLGGIEVAIQNFLAFIGELDGTVILTDWAIVCSTQGWEDGRPINVPTHIFPKRHMPPHRTKGLLVDGLDQLKLTESTVELATIMTVLGRDDDGSDDD